MQFRRRLSFLLSVSPRLRVEFAVARLAHILALASGALLVVGALWPWAYMPMGGLRVPLYPLFGPGCLLPVAGFVILLRPRPSPGLLLAVALGAAWAAHALPPALHASARASTRFLDLWLDPLNQLLSRFNIDPLHLVDWSLPAARAVGPGIPLTHWAAALAAWAALLAFLSGPVPALRRGACPACAAPLPRRRDLRFCPACGAGLTRALFCPACHTPAEPGDRFCGQCGAPLSPTG
jgi:hypothetical protein